MPTEMLAYLLELASQGQSWPQSNVMILSIGMTVLLEEAVNRLRSLPLERQDDLGEIILALVVHDESEFQLDEEQANEVISRLSNPQPMVSIETAQNFLEQFL